MRVKVSKEIKDRVNAILENAKSDKDIKKARKIAKHANYRIPEKYRRLFCHKCNSLLKGKTRLRKGKISIECENCKKITRKKFKN